MNPRVQNHVIGRLSLRPPQAESRARLKQALDAAPEMLRHENREVPAILSTLKAQFSTRDDFEREFPSLCFALATGVGKTRLMGAEGAFPTSVSNDAQHRKSQERRVAPGGYECRIPPSAPSNLWATRLQGQLCTAKCSFAAQKNRGCFLTPPYFPFCAASACLIFWSVLYWLKA
jgi:hypothetical protein